MANRIELRRLCFVFVAAALFPVLAVSAQGIEDPEKNFEHFDASNFSNPTTIDNEWWPLKPGMQYIYEGYTVEDDGEKLPHRIVSTVTDLTKVIGGVRSVVLYDLDIKDDQLEEAELAFKAQDDEGNVWHLGEYTEVYNGEDFVGGQMWAVGHLKGARAGIQMKAKPQLGQPSYSQGLAPPLRTIGPIVAGCPRWDRKPRPLWVTTKMYWLPRNSMMRSPAPSS